MFLLFKKCLKDPTPCPEPQSGYRSNLNYPSRNTREEISSSLLIVLIKDWSQIDVGSNTDQLVTGSGSGQLTLSLRLNVIVHEQIKFISSYMQSSRSQVGN